MVQGHILKTDTLTACELEEVTVVATTQQSLPDKTVYFPTTDQKATASDGLSLLARMQIPQLSVSPVTESVKTADNQNVSLFINFHHATVEEVSGLNPKDVRKVEYLDFPVDPRFMRTPHVVNFITSVHDYGGYTKLSGKERFMARNGEVSVYSKFINKKMEYDLIISGDYDYNPHNGIESDETYHLKEQDIKKLSKIDAGRFHQRGLYTALQANWNKNAELDWRNLVYYNGINIPINDNAGKVYFSSLYPPENYNFHANSSNYAIGWKSELYALLGKGWSLNGTLDADLNHNISATDYSTSFSTIINDANEKSWWLRGDIQLNKSLSESISLFSVMSAGGGHTNIGYSGSSSALNRFQQIFNGVNAGVSLNLQKVSGSVDVGFAFESNIIKGRKIYDNYPFTHINIQYAPTSKNSLGLWLQYATLSPDAVMKNPNTIQQSELLFISGNPDLQCSRLISSNINYTWLPGNRWQFTAYVTFFRILNRQIAVYTPDGPDGMMLKKYQNDGNYSHGQLGARLTARFFEGELTCSFAPRLLFYKTTGSNSINYCPLTASASMDYYVGKFFFDAYWESRSSYVDGETAYLRKMPMALSLSAGWANRGWNIQFSVVNPFRSSWTVSRDMLDTRWFVSSISQFGSDYHRRISVSITYTLNYGKKVNTHNEMENKSGISSSILR